MATIDDIGTDLRDGLIAAFGVGKTIDADRAAYIVQGLALQQVGAANIDGYTDPEDFRGLAADRVLAFLNAAWNTWDNHLTELAQQ